nr:large-conductance mechanosensitive channel protein MscL [Campylobacter sp.]
MAGFFKEFKEFAVKSNAIDMAVGIIIGAAFGKIVDSMVKDIIMPPFGWIMGKVDFSNLYLSLPVEGKIETYASLEAAKAAGAVTINYGVFINTLISFLIVAFCVFLMIKAINKLKSNLEPKADESVAEPTTKQCPKCFSEISIKATKCPHCTADI